jgi:hypothetical protein
MHLDGHLFPALAEKVNFGRLGSDLFGGLTLEPKRAIGVSKPQTRDPMIRYPRRCVGLLILVFGSSLPAQDGPSVTPEESRQFDFWIGEWEVTAGGKAAGTNHIVPILGGRALRETWRGAGGYNGTSTNIYDATTKSWKQFWVDNSGLVLLLEGGVVDGKMVLEGGRIGGDGRPVVDRITWTPNEDGTVRQLWETSQDEGETWEVGFDGLYKKLEVRSEKAEVGRVKKYE